MAEFLVSVVAKAIGCSYMRSHKSYVDDLKREVVKLKLSREIVQHRVDDDKKRGEEIEEYVKQWLSGVDEIMDETERFMEDEKEANNQCFKRICPNLNSCHQLSNRAMKEMEAVAGVLEDRIIDEVFYSSIRKEKWLPSDPVYKALDSRMSTLNNILNGLSNPNVNMVGVYGMAGVGKTMLAMEVAKKAKIENLFDEVIFVWASSTSNIKRIQGQIAYQLGLQLCEETESERARRLCARFRKEKKILVILDDIWTSLDLGMVGIPFGDAHRGCKILLTSRSRDVLVCGMHSQHNYCVSVLNQEEAWSLLTEVVGDCIENSALRSIAVQIATECGGLPIAIITVAMALRNKSLIGWKYALWRLSFPQGDFRGLDRVYSTIELSYSYLEDEELKLTFLLCSLMKNTYDASVTDLLKCVMGLGLFEGTCTIQERRDRLYTLVLKLKDSCLLLDGHTNDSFGMHDIVRDVAISIASRDHNVFTVRNNIPIKWLDMDILKSCTAIILHDSDTGDLPEGLEYPQLTFFCTDPKHAGFQIPDNFFAGMMNLRVLLLAKMRLSSLPSSFHLLLNLQTLCLHQCILGDIAIIGNLEKLEILSFVHSNIERLPGEIGKLTRLKLLDLSNCLKLKVIPPNVISSLSQLEELYLGDTSVEWEFEGLSGERSNASLLELQHLSHLTTLEICVQDAMILRKGLFSKKLERYKISIGDEWDWSSKYDNTRALKLKLNSSIYLNEIIMQLNGIEDLYLDKVPGVKNVLYELDRRGFPQLKHLHVQNNPSILCIVGSMAWVQYEAFPLLESLFLRNLIHLEQICHGQLIAGSLCKLRIIKVRNCDKLKNIFSLSVSRGLPLLQRIEVIKCKNVEEIFTVGREDNIDFDEMDDTEFRELRSLTLKFLPQLTSFYSQVKTAARSKKSHRELTTHKWTREITLEDELDAPMPFFNRKVSLPNLETLELCAISTEKIWHEQLAAVSSYFRNLTRLIVHSCVKLKYLFTSAVVKNFVQLQHLEICYCTALEEIVSKERGAQTAKFFFPRVTFLKLWNLSELRTFYPGIHSSEWPSLKRLEVCGCHNVWTFTSEFLGFQETGKEGQLKFPPQQALLFVEEVPELEELKLSGKDVTVICQAQFRKHLFQKLKMLEIMNDKSENFSTGLLQRFHNLEKLELRQSSYREIFSYGEVEKPDGMIKQIKHLKLWELSDLKYICKEDTKLDSVVQNLEMLEVWWCDNLINLVPSSASFENLTTLEIWYCRGLKNLLTSSTSKSLVNLMKLRIDGCKMMTEIISKEGDVAENKIVFCKLKWLLLEDLQSLTSFCSGNFNFKFPSLEDLYVIECPKMKIFSEGVLSTPLLQVVWQNWGLDKQSWEGDLNTTIQKLHKEKQESAVWQQPNIHPTLPEWLKSTMTQAKGKMIQMQHSTKKNPLVTGGQMVRRVMEDTSTQSRGLIGDVKTMDLSVSGGDISLKKKRSSDNVVTRREYGPHISPDDGYTWRKYGQKEILGAKFPRSYYCCAFRYSTKCYAVKKVQQLDDNPSSFEITYRGVHSCHLSSKALSVPSSSTDITEEMTQKATFQPSPSMDLLVLAGDLSFKNKRSSDNVVTRREYGPHISPDDGYTWRKYGQKEILGAKFPRSYYRCSLKYSTQCQATKQVQQLDDNSFSFTITYRGVHTCHLSSEAPPVPSSSADITKEMSKKATSQPSPSMLADSSKRI